MAIDLYDEKWNSAVSAITSCRCIKINPSLNIFIELYRPSVILIFYYFTLCQNTLMNLQCFCQMQLLYKRRNIISIRKTLCFKIGVIGQPSMALSFTVSWFIFGLWLHGKNVFPKSWNIMESSKWPSKYHLSINFLT